MNGPGQPLLSTGGVQLTNATTTLYTTPTAPSSVAVALEQITVANTSAAAHTWTLYCVPPGGTAGDGNAIGVAVTIAANKTYVITGCWWLLSGWTLQGKADANTVVTLRFDGKVFQ